MFGVSGQQGSEAGNRSPRGLESRSSRNLQLTEGGQRMPVTNCTRTLVVAQLVLFWMVGTRAAEGDTCQNLRLVLAEDFEQGADRWETTDEASWSLHPHGDGKAFGLNRRVSNYRPRLRSPHNIALIKGVSVGDFVLKLSVKSTLDTGGHRDCCLFFSYQDQAHFYYVHLGARPDPHSGQIMIVNGEPRVALTRNNNRTPWDEHWHEVKLVRDVQNGKIEVYFDDMDKPLMQAVDKAFGRGRIGIGSFDDMNDFDDIKLYGN